MAGVLSEPEAVLASVFGRQDLLQEVKKFQRAGRDMLCMLSQVLMGQAEADENMKMIGTEMGRLNRVQKVNALLTAVFSFAPLGAAAAATAIGAVAEAMPLLERMLSTGVAIQGAATPVLPDKFCFPC